MRSFIGSFMVSVRQPPLRTPIWGPKAELLTPAVSVSSTIPILFVALQPVSNGHSLTKR